MKKNDDIRMKTIYDFENENLRIFCEEFFDSVGLGQLQTLIMNGYVDEKSLKNYKITEEQFKKALVVILTDRIRSEFQDMIAYSEFEREAYEDEHKKLLKQEYYKDEHKKLLKH